MSGPKWLNDAVFYEIYPQSFQDTNGDGIGDFEGIIERLDYIKNLGCNALWINPCYDSPFKDAGYDVRDYKSVAPRYGTNEDLYRLFDEAHRRSMHVFLDLVPGHTSEEHAWFRESGRAGHNEYSGRYIWSDLWIAGMQGHPYIAGECERNGTYMLNFFKCQPALNYGFGTVTAPWQDGLDDPEPHRTREAMKDVMRFWLSHGCDGFRVDMADSLVKDDDDSKSGTAEVWRDLRRVIDEEYPEAALVSEWSNPKQAVLGAHFNMDFYLDHPGKAYNTLVRDNETEGPDRSFFRKDAGGDIERFLPQFLSDYEAVKGHGHIAFITCNHDTPRMSRTLTERERKLAYAFLFTLPGVPFLYYGDEIGIPYFEDLPTKEGGYTRTGTRTPMQWNHERNLGFSTADAAKLYLPVDPSEDAATVEDAEADPDSLYHTVQDILQLRHAQDDLKADGEFAVVYAKKESCPFLYRRGSLLLGVNPSGSAVTVPWEELSQVPDQLAGRKSAEPLFCVGGGSAEAEGITLEAQSFMIVR